MSVAGLALPVRVWAQRFAFLGLLAIAFALMLLSKAETDALERARTAIIDATVPVLDVMSRPVEAGRAAAQSVESFFIVRAENETNYCPRCQTGGKLLRDRALSQLLRKDWPKTIDELEGLKP